MLPSCKPLHSSCSLSRRSCPQGSSGTNHWQNCTNFFYDTIPEWALHHAVDAVLVIFALLFTVLSIYVSQSIRYHFFTSCKDLYEHLVYKLRYLRPTVTQDVSRLIQYLDHTSRVTPSRCLQLTAQMVTTSIKQLILPLPSPIGHSGFTTSLSCKSSLCSRKRSTSRHHEHTSRQRQGSTPSFHSTRSTMGRSRPKRYQSLKNHWSPAGNGIVRGRT